MKRKLSYIIVPAVIFFLGVSLFLACRPASVEDPSPALPTTSHVKITIGEKYSASDEGGSTTATSDFTGTRVLSWFGQSPIQATEKRLGLSWGKEGIAFGGSKGYGILESLWDTVKDVFWFAAFGLGALVVMLFIPATSAIAGTILRFLAGIIPFLGSLVERVRAKFAYEKPLVQVVRGVDSWKAEFEKQVNAAEWLTAEQKADVIKLFDDTRAIAMNAEQDKDSTQKTVTAIRSGA